LAFHGFAGAQSDTGASIKSVSENSDNRVAPGDFLTVSVKLVNFGAQKRVDVVVDYKILDSGKKEVYKENETVAVETTASFVKRLQLPQNIKPGVYTLVSVLNYPYQEQPAVSEFTFTVENKIGSFFQSDLILFSVIALLAVAILVACIYFFSSFLQKRRVQLFDYSDKPKDQIIYYQILSNIIAEMRMRVGDDALQIAADIPDLQINDKTGYIINIKKEPAKIIALLISRYEKMTGQKISFALK
jgi:hypothetical protein